MDPASVRARGQAFVERLHTDTCRITKPGEGRGPLNPVTGKYDDPPEVTVYEGPCRIPARSAANSSAAVAGEATWAVGEHPFAVPLTAAGSVDVEPGMTVHYLTAAHDQALTGRVFGVVAPLRSSLPIERVFKVKETVGGGGN